MKNRKVKVRWTNKRSLPQSKSVWLNDVPALRRRHVEAGADPTSFAWADVNRRNWRAVR